MVTTMLVWEAARREAAQLREELGTSDPFAISEALGINVIETAMPAGVSGMIVRKDGGEARIFVEESQVAGRRRFTCAHELGHFIERTNIAGDTDFSFRDERSTKYDLHEFFADEFAGELLMPAREILSKKREGASNTSLAAFYRVTVRAVEKRLDRLEKNPPSQ